MGYRSEQEGITYIPPTLSQFGYVALKGRDGSQVRRGGHIYIPLPSHNSVLLPYRVGMGRRSEGEDITYIPPTLSQFGSVALDGRNVAFTRYSHYQYRVVYGIQKEGRRGVMYCAIVVQSFCTSAGNAGGRE